MNPLDAALFPPAPCLPCPTVPADCSCALLIPPFGSPYADYATAAAFLADPMYVSGCIGYSEHFPPGDPDNTFTASFDGTTLQLDGHVERNGALPGNAICHFYASVSLKAESIVSVDYVITTDGTTYQNEIELLACADGASVDSDLATTATGTLTVTAPADGEYVIHIGSQAGSTTPDANYVTATNAVTCDDTFWVNPVIALWDDSGTTRSLWACPKLLLPPLTESTGDWYADCAAADAILTNSVVSNCVGYLASGVDPFGVPLDFSQFSFFSYTMVEGGSTLEQRLMNGGNEGNLRAFMCMTSLGGFNADAGDVITVDWSVSGSGGTGQSGSASLYDDTGTLIETASNTTGADLVFSALPYTGRYTISVYVCFETITDLWGDIDALAIVSSSGSFLQNPIQARYDLGLTCAATLDCGDACP